MLGRTQEQFGKTLGVSRNSVARFERDALRMALPTVKLFRLVEALVNVLELRIEGRKEKR